MSFILRNLLEVVNMYWAVTLPFLVGYHIIKFQLEDGEVNPVFWIAIQEQQMSLTCTLRCMDDFENLLELLPKG